MRRQRGFTIVELLMVIGIISVLMSIAVTAVSQSLRQARSQRANALCTLVEQGIATYYAQKDEWPVEPGEPNCDSSGDRSKEKTHYVYDGEDVRLMVRKVVEETKNNNPMIDVSGLFVSTSTGESNSKGYGMDFLTAIHGTKRNRNRLKLNQMYFGYQDAGSGYFRRFKMIYSPQTDHVNVSTL